MFSLLKSTREVFTSDIYIIDKETFYYEHFYNKFIKLLLNKDIKNYKKYFYLIILTNFYYTSYLYARYTSYN